MFSLWYLVLGAKEYRQDGRTCGPSKSTPPPPTPSKPDLIPKPSEPIPIAKPQGPSDPVVSKAKTPEPPKPAPPKPPRPDPPRQSPPKVPETPWSQPPKEPEPPKPAPPKPSPPLAPKPPSPVKAPESPQPHPSSQPLQPAPAIKQSPPKNPEPFQPPAQPLRPSPQSREDELLSKTLNFGQRPEQNGARGGPRDLSYSSGPAPGSPGVRGSSPRFTERTVVSNPDSLESSEAED